MLYYVAASPKLKTLIPTLSLSSFHDVARFGIGRIFTNIWNRFRPTVHTTQDYRAEMAYKMITEVVYKNKDF